MSEDQTYLTPEQVMSRYGGCSDMWIRRRVERDGFPQPHRLGSAKSRRLWLRSELQAWDDAQAAKLREALS